MTSAYTARQDLKICQTNNSAQKIDGFTLKIFGIVLTSFQIEDKLGKVQFLQETFLMADTNMAVILGMPFLILNNIDMFFSKREFTWQLYILAKALLMTKPMQIIGYKKFATVVLDRIKQAFIVYVAYLDMKMLIYLLKKLE